MMARWAGASYDVGVDSQVSNRVSKGFGFAKSLMPSQALQPMIYGRIGRASVPVIWRPTILRILSTAHKATLGFLREEMERYPIHERDSFGTKLVMIGTRGYMKAITGRGNPNCTNLRIA